MKKENCFKRFFNGLVEANMLEMSRYSKYMKYKKL